MALGAASLLTDWGQAISVILGGLAAFIVAVTGLLRASGELRQRHSDHSAPAPAPPDDEAPDKHEVWLDVLTRLSEAQEDTERARAERDQARAERDEARAAAAEWERKWTEANTELLALLRARGRRRGGGSSQSSG